MSASGSVSTWIATGRPIVTSGLPQFHEYDALSPGSMRMVDPLDGEALAARIADVLARARVVGSVAAAVADCGFVAATTSRDRDQNFRVLDVRDAAARAVEETARGPVALLFGAERTGLTNDELEHAHVLVRIPASPEYASLNLSMAVQLVAYAAARRDWLRHGEADEDVAVSQGHVVVVNLTKIAGTKGKSDLEF